MTQYTYRVTIKKRTSKIGRKTMHVKDICFYDDGAID